MPDMELARRVREHFEDVIFWPAGLSFGLKQPPLAPDALPFGFGFPEIVSRHGGDLARFVPRRKPDCYAREEWAAVNWASGPKPASVDALG
jgi:hypothetical protein